ncbi:Malto-oligosyltrehalose trehalohydrolase [Chitinispirillum alkaliphilum]|nr:Malto-oligosyltrehalose trehalohydrolase [Chitinispirillum alkaliphilum]
MIEVGSRIKDDKCLFSVWAPLKDSVKLRIIEPVEKTLPMQKDKFGYWSAVVEGVGHGTQYLYLIDDSLERPDPASHFQPLGVHGPSMVIDHSRFSWSGKRKSQTALDDYIIYEMHPGTFTPGGTFLSAVERLDHLVELGITAVEIMPVAQFPGERNWGYDGVYPFAVQNSYGGPDELKGFVDACHERNLSVILDVVYNHLGPEGNYLRDFGPYFTDKYRTPWGESLNFDDSYSDPVCDYFIANALHWLGEYKIDALRLDAVHAIFDMGAKPFLSRLAKAVDETFTGAESPRYLIAESDLNDSRVIRRREGEGGFGIHCQWSDDFHHALHTILTGESRGYYMDFGTAEHLYRAYKNSFCYAGDYSFERKRTHGNDVSGFDTKYFVVCSQNHDQIGNRMLGERLITLTDFERAKVAASSVILSPYIPLLFMGEEIAEENPFLYFADHTDDSLKQAVREGRKREFAEFHSAGDPLDPFATDTFEKSKIKWERLEHKAGIRMYNYYRTLIGLRKSVKALGTCSRNRLEVTLHEGTPCISLYYKHNEGNALCFFNYGNENYEIDYNPDQSLKKRFDSASGEWSDTPAPLPEHISSEGARIRMAPFQSAVYIT